jgi:hypothetical protein
LGDGIIDIEVIAVTNAKEGEIDHLKWGYEYQNINQEMIC